MTTCKRRAVWGVLAIGVLSAAGCAHGEVHVLNTAEGGVDVQLGDDEVNDVTAEGGALLYTNECFDGPIVVTYTDGRTVKLAGPVCPGQELVVTDERVELVEMESTA